MFPWVVSLWLALHPVPPAESKIPLGGVERIFRLELGPTPTSPVVRYLPGRVGFQVDLAAEPETLRSAVEALARPYVVSVEPSESGARVRVVHRNDTVRAQTVSDPRSKQVAIEFGSRSEDSRLRVLASYIRRPLPEPSDLGAYLELWQDAERATGDGELEQAKRLWEKLQQTSHLDDLAALRVAQLYLISGHVNEAAARLRQVSRRYPRSTGASLARLDLLHVETVTGIQRATLDQIDQAAESIDRRQFEAYARIRAALILDELGETALALLRLPEPASLPAVWQGPAELEQHRILERAITLPVWTGDPLGTIAAWSAWSERTTEHPRRSEIVDSVIEAHARVGLFDPIIHLVRARLRELPAAIDEGMLVVRLAQAYHQQKDLFRQAEVLAFALTKHPRCPELPALLRGYAIQAQAKEGLQAARARLATLRGIADGPLQHTLGELDVDLVLAYADASAQAQALTELQKLGFADPARREPELALALARAGRPGDAAPLLRKWIGRTTDPEARDKLSYNLAMAELALGHASDAEKIMHLLTSAGTHYGLIARTYLRSRELQTVLEQPLAIPGGEGDTP